MALYVEATFERKLSRQKSPRNFRFTFFGKWRQNVKFRFRVPQNTSLCETITPFDALSVKIGAAVLAAESGKKKSDQEFKESGGRTKRGPRNESLQVGSRGEVPVETEPKLRIGRDENWPQRWLWIVIPASASMVTTDEHDRNQTNKPRQMHNFHEVLGRSRPS